MQSKRSSSSLPLLACTLALGLSGCAAEPLVQMAVTRLSPQPPCAAGTNCPTNVASGSFGDMPKGLFDSKGILDSFHKLTGAPPDQQTTTAVTTTPAPVK